MVITRKHILFIIIFLNVLFIQSCRDDISLNAPNGLIVILKADDYGEASENWNRFIKMIIDDSINANIGVIPRNVKTSSSISDIRRISNLKNSKNSPIIEFWAHGYDHSYTGKIPEFQTNNLDYQIDHIKKAQSFFSDTLNISNNTFSTPFNSSSINTYFALKKFPEINIWMCYQENENQFHTEWKDPNLHVIKKSDKNILLNITYTSLGKFTPSNIMNNFEIDKKRAYIIIQIHPAFWNDEIFVDFEKLIYFYKTKKAIFMTPNQYLNYLHKMDN